MKHDLSLQLKEELGKNHACYVLITCDEPSIAGDFQVEMTSEGDPTLISYLLHGAQNIIDNHGMQTIE